LINAKQRGLITAIKPVLDEMLASGFFLDTTNYRSILQRAGE
jgi:predicted nucleic acid-binding protein